MKYTKEVKTALLALVAIILFIFGYGFLAGTNWFSSSKTFYAVYEDVEGLTPSSPVTINGLRVGSVSEIGFLNPQGDLLVTFTVDTELPFSEESIAQIYGEGLISGKSLAILPEYDAESLADDGDTLPGQVEESLLDMVNDRLSPLQEKVEGALKSTDKLIESFNDVMNPETRENLKAGIVNLNQTVASLERSSKSIESILNTNEVKIDTALANIAVITSNLETFSQSLTAIEVQEIANELEATAAHLESFTQKLNSGDGTAAKLVNDPSVYNNLERATHQLEQLIQDVKLNPQRYVQFSIFGNNPGPYAPPRD